MTKFRELEERKYVNGDMEKIHLRPEDKGRDSDKLENAYSYYDGDQIIGIVGGSKINDNTCEMFIILDECSTQYVREVYHYTYQVLNDLQQHFKRIQAVVRTDWSKAVHFLERLGFKKECLMKKFGSDGSNYHLYAKLR